ncbi:WD40 repeat-like protein [Jaminaea rosea]|uniref:WD40 repeat-like protein n=1 Tax=Jaminaea rosea TaxID=1569628 RepID=A0A316UIS5_9BASI|nr:WD40 repeat-like protein [Jaminaea rosea]PWN25119.1 WD40 repeat-like protein [Jaminaea rosea]
MAGPDKPDKAGSAAAEGSSSKDSSNAQRFTPVQSSSTEDNAAPPTSTSSSSLTTSVVIEYLRTRGFERSEQVLKAELEALAAGKSPEEAQAAGVAAGGTPYARTLSMGELASKSAPRDLAGAAAGEKGQASGAGGAANPGPLEVLAADALKIDRTDRTRGFGMVRNWCQGGLDVYQAELRPLLLPLFVHSYLDLVEMGLDAAAASLLALHGDSLLPLHPGLLAHLRSVTRRVHMGADELVQRFRAERYVLKMSQTVFGLLLGWLTDGTGPVASAGAGEGVGGNEAEPPATRGRLAMLRIINERCRIQVLRAKPYELTPEMLEEGTGLTSAGPSYSAVGTGPAGGSKRGAASTSSTGASRDYPALQSAAVSQGGDAIAEFNAKNAGPQLKLGPKFPLSERLADEVQREATEEVRDEEEERKQREKKERGTSPPAEKGQKDGEQMDGVETSTADKQGENDTSESPRKRSKSKEATPARASRAGTGTPAPGAKASGSVAPQSGKDKGGATNLGGDEDDRSDLIQPTVADLPPQAPLFRSVDIMREVAKLRDARKSLRIDPSLPASSSSGSTTTPWMRRAALPSICAYTYHDVGDAGLTCSTFSEDTTLMAAGFEESYVQIWSLKGEPLAGLRGDVHLPDVRDRTSLERQRVKVKRQRPNGQEDEGEDPAYLSTRKLIGHSGPVYSLSFDNVGGTASAPRTLLSSSADSTVRLWSMDTLSALVSYRGHQGPVWNVEYSPSSIYFATAGADRTARLWSTERAHALRMYAGHLSDVDCLSFHPNSLYLATGSSDRTARLWDVQRGACVRLFVGHSSPVGCVKVSPDGRYLATAGSGNGGGSGLGAASGEDEASISLWDLGSGRRIKKMWGHQGRINSLDFTATGNVLISAADDCTVRCWDVRGTGGAKGASASPEDGDVAGISNGGAGGNGVIPGSGVRVEDASADCVATFRTKRTPMVDVRVTPRNLCLVAGAYDAGPLSGMDGEM